MVLEHILYETKTNLLYAVLVQSSMLNLVTAIIFFVWNLYSCSVLIFTTFYLQHARTHSYGYFIGLPSLHGNTLLPVIPRFDSSGNVK